MVREVILEGDSILRKTMPDATFGKNINNIVRILTDLKDTMFATGAVGFAANQIGEFTNICIVRMPDDKVLELVNPTILTRKNRHYSPEGCLSIPGYWAIVPRWSHIKIGYQTRDGKSKLVELDPSPSVFAQHEIDHLHGIMIRDYVEKLNGKAGGVTYDFGTLQK